jgi:hypothetical protein
MNQQPYLVRSFAQAVYLMAHGHRPVRITGGVESPIFYFDPEAREVALQFTRSKNELSAMVYAAATVDGNTEPDDSLGNRRRT